MEKAVGQIIEVVLAVCVVVIVGSGLMFFINGGFDAQNTAGVKNDNSVLAKVEKAIDSQITNVTNAATSATSKTPADHH